ncbi:hypothetical protein SAMN05216311_113242 [Chitinophaga sp. CF418]|nr:hypothetical protein SAMN05216311_113242 [Chitinophaga sp. CF418]
MILLLHRIEGADHKVGPFFIGSSTAVYLLFTHLKPRFSSPDSGEVFILAVTL